MNRQSEDVRLVLNHDPALGRIHTSVESFVSFDHDMTYELENFVNRWIDRAAPFKAMRAYDGLPRPTRTTS